ncbi:CHAT domain-containing protein [Romeriopsis navalis]|uniref:CHAT domain-containing protein n=1 Tax=Romeriopsis navalis TaxID=2992132 RepID=UPI0021F8A337|nr:CHAT domain-containing protein [Romeriopsis navalis]
MRIKKALYLVLTLGMAIIILISHDSTAITQARTVDPVAVPVSASKLKQAFAQNDIASVIRQLELGWKYNFERYYQRRFTTPYLSLEGIQLRLNNLQKSTNQKTGLVYAVPGAKQLELILVPPTGEPIHKTVVVDRQTLTRTAQDFRLETVNSSSSPDDYLPPAQQMYEWLIQPIADEIDTQQIDTLLFCVGKGLRGLPLAALHDGQKFLIERYNLALIPAFNLLNHHPNILSDTKVLAMGASEFSNNPALPAVPLELRSITQNNWSGEVLLNQDFTLENLAEARSRNFGVIHLATHASITANSARESYLQFWDQRLSLDQMKSLNLQTPAVQLLVLSACQTALGSAQAELGFAGFAVQSGAKAVIASLWKVNDVGTLVLMSELYKHLGTTQIKAQALRQVQIDLLQGNITIDNSSILKDSSNPTLQAAIKQLDSPNLKHPYHWAAFTLIGNPW